MKAKISLILSFLLVLMLILPACGNNAPKDLAKVTTGIDFSDSKYAHVTNGGAYNREESLITSVSHMPYDIDAITGATLTVEGPAMKESVPFPVGQLESYDTILARGQYYNGKKTYTYEGADLWCLLNDLQESEGIIPTDKAYNVVIKNSNREDIATFTLENVKKAHDEGRPILLAYGMGTEDEKTVAPFVFNGKNSGEHSEGYIKELDNDDGCLRLVYDPVYNGTEYCEFQNAAYVYVCEESTPGYKHDGSTGAYSDTSLTDYIITFRGEALGYEVDMTTAQLESLVTYDDKGNVKDGGIGYRDSYSLANNTYWYVNTYEGLKLYDLLCYLGMPTYDEMGAKVARTTLISFLASDGVTSSERFSVDSLSYPDAFGFYKKNSADNNDGTYQSTNADLVGTGYPVLMAYGFNNYPYVIGKKDDGFLSGLSNSGGPFRIIFGKTSYNHANGSNQVQYLSDVIIGNDVYYSTHKYSTDESLLALADTKLPISFTASGKDAGSLSDFTVGDLEELIYGKKVTANAKKSAQVKAVYGDDIYEGLDLYYLLSSTLDVPYLSDASALTGTVTVKTANGEEKIALSDIASGKYVLAFAKNGTPLVETEKSAGYVSARALNPVASTDPAAYTVENIGGPIELLVKNSDGTVTYLSAVNGIDVSLDISASQLKSLREKAAEEARIAENAVPNADVAWNHSLSEEYASLLSSTLELTIANDRNEFTYTFTVQELEALTSVIFRDRYTVMDIGQCEGLDLWKFIKLVCGYDPNNSGYVKGSQAASFIATSPVEGLEDVQSVTLSAPDGYEIELVSIFLKDTVQNGIVADDGRTLPIMLCYGTRGYPLVDRSVDDGYVESALNEYGPLRIITEKSSQASMKHCVKVIVKLPGTGDLSFGS